MGIQSLPMIGPLGSLNVYSNAQIEEVVNQSAVCYVAQVVCQEDRSMIVPMYNWSTRLAPHFKKIVGIKKFHHFRMLSSAPGILYVTEHTDTEEVSSLQHVVFYTRNTVRNRAH